MKNSTKFWLIVIGINLLSLIITYPCIMFKVLLLIIILGGVLFILGSFIFYDYEEKWYKTKWHMFGKYNLMHLIYKFNNWLNNKNFNNN